MKPRSIRREVVEAFRLGDIAARVIRQEADDRVRHVVAFAASELELEDAAEFELDELEDLLAAIQASLAIIDFSEGRSGPMRLAKKLIELNLNRVTSS